jgi:uncharacterized membrane protein
MDDRTSKAKSDTTPSGRPRPQLRVVRVVRARPRLFISALLGLAAFAIVAIAFDWRWSTRLLVGWDAGIVFYLILVASLAARSDVHRIRRRASLQDEGQITILIFTIAAAMASLAAIFVELGQTAGNPRLPGHLVLAASTILLSWAFIHSMFGLHYAHEYYGNGRDHRIGGMSFPEDTEPDYWDFAYFSFTIGMCAQVSDVTVSSKVIRRTVLVHSILSFIFNAALLALTVNIAASAI